MDDVMVNAIDPQVSEIGPAHTINANVFKPADFGCS